MNPLIKLLDKLGKELEKKAVPRPLKITAPAELHFELTYKCNTKCIMCNLRYLKSEREELNIKDYRNIFDGAKSLKNVKLIVFSGGEPWLKEDFLDIFKYFADKYPESNLLILSNLYDTGLVTKNLDRIKSLADIKRVSIGSSLDGIGDVHDRIRGQKGSFKALENTMRVLKDRYPEIYFSLNFTIIPENCDQIIPTFEWCEKNKHHISYQVMVQKKQTKQFKWDSTNYRTVKDQIYKIIEKSSKNIGLNDILKNPGLMSFLLSLYYIPKYIKERKRFYPNCPCGEKYAMLDPSGNLYFCPVYKDKIAGNLKDVGFDKLWASQKANEIRDFFNNKKCHCWLTCTNGFMIEDAMKS
ncbi:MAG: radical SAM protein [Endomicrobiales bacterium]|nr:radical SAM protein [Endomicrobiales bacterium]